MKKSIIFVAAFALMAATCTQDPKPVDNRQDEIDSLNAIINQKDGETDDLVNLLSEIQDGFDKINEAEGRVNILKNGVEKVNSSEEIRENMSFIQQTLEQNKRKIEELQDKLKQDNSAFAKLEGTVKSLTDQLNEKAKDIESLMAQLEEKNLKIADLDASVNRLTEENRVVKEEKDRTEEIAKNQDAQMNSAWYVFGTKKELTSHNILVKGDVLKNDNFDKDYMTKIDIRQTTTFSLGSRYAKILTTHPEGSYTLLKDSKGDYTLKVTDVSKFWSVSKYLVIRVK